MNLVFAVATDPQHLLSSSLISRVIPAPQGCLSSCLGHHVRAILQGSHGQEVPALRSKCSRCCFATHLRAKPWTCLQAGTGEETLFSALIWSESWWQTHEESQGHLCPLGREEEVCFSWLLLSELPETSDIRRKSNTLHSQGDIISKGGTGRYVLGSESKYWILSRSREQAVVFQNIFFPFYSGSMFYSWLLCVSWGAQGHWKDQSSMCHAVLVWYFLIVMNLGSFIS